MATTLSPGVEPLMGAQVDRLVRAGFDHTYRVLPDGRVWCDTCRHEARAHDLNVASFHRFEGESDPDDMTLVTALSWPDDEKCKGVLVLGFGPMSSPDHKRVLADLALDHPHLHG
jgi:hypothetical protein